MSRVEVLYLKFMQKQFYALFNQVKNLDFQSVDLWMNHEEGKKFLEDEKVPFKATRHLMFVQAWNAALSDENYNWYLIKMYLKQVFAEFDDVEHIVFDLVANAKKDSDMSTAINILNKLQLI